MGEERSCPEAPFLVQDRLEKGGGLHEPLHEKVRLA
jgi:hypothetical protein